MEFLFLEHWNINKLTYPTHCYQKPIKEISPVEIHTEYEMKVPFPFSNARHIHGSILSKHENNYLMKWYYVSSNSTKNTFGHALFSPLSETESLMEYQTFVWPNSSLASLVESIMKKKTLAAVKTIKAHIEMLNEQNSPLIPQFVKRTHDALAGQFVYTDIIKKKSVNIFLLTHWKFFNFFALFI